MQTDDEIVRAHIARQPRREQFASAADYESALQTWRSKLAAAIASAGFGPTGERLRRVNLDDWSGR